MRLSMRVPAWLWPKRLKDAPSAVARLGRVIHWACVALALVVGVAGLWETYLTYENASESRIEIANWDKGHPTVPLEKLTDRQFEVVEKWWVDNEWTDEDRPFEVTPENAPLAMGVGFALLILMLGRGLRYVLASE